MADNAPTDIGNTTMTALREETRQADLQQSMNSGLINPTPLKVAVVKAMPINYPKEAWTQLAPIAGNIGFAAVADAAERVSGWNLSPWVWDMIIATGAVFGVGVFVSFVLNLHRRKRNNDTVTQLLLEANTTRDNTIQLIDCDPEVVRAYAANGYKIITR